MFSSLFLFRRVLATTLLVIFANVLVGECWCTALKATPHILATDGESCVMGSPGTAMPGDCCGSTRLGQPRKAATSHHTPASKSAQYRACCKSRLSLNSPTRPEDHAHSPVLAVLPGTIHFCFRPMSGAWDATLPVALVPAWHLKPKIPDIRIFIRSLII